MARRRVGLTQCQLAERLGLRQAIIARGRGRRGDRGVSVDDVELVAAMRAACSSTAASPSRVLGARWPVIVMQLDSIRLMKSGRL